MICCQGLWLIRSLHRFEQSISLVWITAILDGMLERFFVQARLLYRCRLLIHLIQISLALLDFPLRVEILLCGLEELVECSFGVTPS